MEDHNEDQRDSTSFHRRTWPFTGFHSCIHEHSRSDREGRDTYVEILWDKTEDGHEKNFEKWPTENVGPYDFESIMHYGPRAFCKNGEPTIAARPGYTESAQLMGNLDHLSNGDRADIAWHYGALEVEIQDPVFKAFGLENSDDKGDMVLDRVINDPIIRIATPGRGDIHSIRKV